LLSQRGSASPDLSARRAPPSETSRRGTRSPCLRRAHMRGRGRQAGPPIVGEEERREKGFGGNSSPGENRQGAHRRCRQVARRACPPVTPPAGARLRASNRISRARVPGAGGPDARRGDESTLRSRSMRSRNDADGPPPPGTLRAGPICFASLRRTSSSCLSVDTTSGVLLGLLASRPSAGSGIFCLRLLTSRG